MRSLQAPYRVPPDPGYIGGYNWGPMLAGFVVLLLWNVAATQWMAHGFHYESFLGSALFRNKDFAVYQPFSWCVWVWRYAGSPNSDLRHPIELGILILACGCLATLGMFFVLNMQRTKKLSRNAEDIHGSARWATQSDIKLTGLLDAKTGVYVGGNGESRVGGDQEHADFCD